MKLTKRQLDKLINSAIHESVSDQRRSALDAAIAAIRAKHGHNAIVDTHSTAQDDNTHDAVAGKLSNDWMKFVMRQSQKYQATLLHIWDHLRDGDNPASVRDIYFNDLDNDTGIAGAITFYGRKMQKGRPYLTGAQIGEKISAQKLDKAKRNRQRVKYIILPGNRKLKKPAVSNSHLVCRC